MALLCGAYSDKYGRKIPIFLPSLGSVFAVMFYILSDLVPMYRILLIYCGLVLQGLFGKSSVITMAVNSIVCDLSSSCNRTKNMGILLSANFIGVCVGSLLSGLVQDILDLSMTFLTVTIFHGASILFTVFLLDETVVYKHDSKSKATKCELCEVFKPSNILDALHVITKPRFMNYRRIIILLLMISLVTQTCRAGEADVNLLFITRSPLNWPKSWYGYLMALEYAVKGLGLCLLPVLSNYFMLSDVTIILLGMICKLARSMWAGFCDTSWMVFVSVAIGAMAGMITSALRSLLSKMVDTDEAGKMFAILSVAETSSKFLGSFIFLSIYSLTAHIFPGIAYLVESFMYCCVLLALIIVFKSLKKVQSAAVM
jgi:MFS family permease